MRSGTQGLSLVKADQPNDEMFNQFWLNCVKKIDRPLAKAKWDAITGPRGLETKMLDRDSGAYVPVHLQATADELIAGMKRYARTQIDANFKLKDGGKFTCSPAVWLNRGRWQDE